MCTNSDPLLGNISGFDQTFMFYYLRKCLHYQNRYLTDFLKVYSHLSSWALNYRSIKFLFLMCLSTNSFDGLTKNLVMTNSSTALLYRSHHNKTFMQNHVVFWMKFSWCCIYICLKHKCNNLESGNISILQFYWINCLGVPLRIMPQEKYTLQHCCRPPSCIRNCH